MIHYLIFHLPFQEEFVYEDHRKAASQMSSLSQSSSFLTVCSPNHSHHSFIYHHPGDKNPCPTDNQNFAGLACRAGKSITLLPALP